MYWHQLYQAKSVQTAVFNFRVILDVISIDLQAVLHVVDASTQLSAVGFLPNISAATAWYVFLESWSMIFIGLPKRILVKQCSSFTDQFVAIGSLSRVNVSHTRVKSHKSLVNGERYHQPFQTTLHKVKIARPPLPRKRLLDMGVTTKNDVLGPEALFSSTVAFGEFMKVRIAGDATIPAQRAQHVHILPVKLENRWKGSWNGSFLSLN